ncbi:hypothetical protein MMC30_006615 [Trapelia coarctata]|nr:hypothetical protein [Trapelia coarctata]
MQFQKLRCGLLLTSLLFGNIALSSVIRLSAEISDNTDNALLTSIPSIICPAEKVYNPCRAYCRCQSGIKICGPETPDSDRCFKKCSCPTGPPSKPLPPSRPPPVTESCKEPVVDLTSAITCNPGPDYSRCRKDCECKDGTKVCHLKSPLFEKCVAGCTCPRPGAILISEAEDFDSASGVLTETEADLKELDWELEEVIMPTNDIHQRPLDQDVGAEMLIECKNWQGNFLSDKQAVAVCGSICFCEQEKKGSKQYYFNCNGTQKDKCFRSCVAKTCP